MKRWKENSLIIADGHWRFLGTCEKDGYARVSWLTSHGKMALLHRVSAHIFLGLDLDDPKQFACHKRECNYKDCWNPEHLYIGNRSTNEQDKIALGRHRNQWSKSILDEKLALDEIKRLMDG